MKRIFAPAALAMFASVLFCAPPAIAQHVGPSEAGVRSALTAPVRVVPQQDHSRRNVILTPTWQGPSYPPPLGVTFTQSGATNDGTISRSGGKTWHFTDIFLAGSTQVYWGTYQMRLSFRNGTGAPDFLTLSSISGNTAIWSGTTAFCCGGPIVYTRFVLTATKAVDGSGGPLNLVPGSVPGIANDVVAPVTGPFTVNMQFQASFDNASWIPALNLFDANNPLYGNGVFNCLSSVDAGFWYAPYVITPSASGGGTISPSTPAEVVFNGNSPTYTFSPAACQSLTDVVLDGITHLGPVANYTFMGVTASHTIQAVFATTTYAITTSAGTGGTITPSFSANCGSDQKISISANPCYTISGVVVDGNPVGAVSTYTLTNVQAPHTVSATFAAIQQTLGVTIVGNGSVNESPNQPTYDCGSTVNLDANPDPGWHFQGWSGDASGPSELTSVLMSTDRNVTATFAIGLAVGDATVTEFALGKVSPNPARGAVTAEYLVAREAHVRLSVVDLQGRTVSTLVDRVESAGRHQATWDSRSTRASSSAGIYFLRYEAMGHTYQRRLAIMH